MENFNLASLPPSMLHKILSKVATTSIPDFGSARIAFPGFNEVGRDDYFYRSANLIYLNDWLDEVNAVRTFRLNYYRLGNPEAIYLRGMYEFFILHLVDKGREKIQLAGERGCSLAKFVDGMMNLGFSVDDRGLVHNYPAFTRQHVDQMFQIISSWQLKVHYDYDKPGMFLSVMERVDPKVSYDCWCSRLIEPMFVVSLNGSRSPWKCDRCFWQCVAWDFCDYIYLNARAWPIEN
ncbi:hypothetical protein Bca4012_025358 [Brassica carinata]|uniref:At2g35280-like TPR domain-containing protein n=1 Tax=Brassica carinata TaxID=52824 RepID=A0A8X8AT36_BRACI|nr:hypothetical protein Bca52824_022409 [Brassica carinata]